MRSINWFRARGLWRSLVVSLGVSGFFVGCSSLPVTETGHRGLFQKNDQVNRSSLPVSLPPGAKTSATSDFGFIWPVKEGSVTSFFGDRKRDFHEGLDIRANRGTPIYAARAGEVIYSSRKIHGYGNMIVIKHDDGLATVYAHNKKNLVLVGQRVAQGALVGYVGATGKATGPHLHFEIRKDELAQDPLLYLPQVRTPAVARQ